MPFFQVVPAQTTDSSPRRRWVFRQGTPKVPGDAVCDSHGSFASDEDARRDIALARKMFAGARFAKVE